MYNKVQLLVRNGPQVTGAEWGQGQASRRNMVITLLVRLVAVPYVHPYSIYILAVWTLEWKCPKCQHMKGAVY